MENSKCAINWDWEWKFRVNENLTLSGVTWSLSSWTLFVSLTQAPSPFKGLPSLTLHIAYQSHPAPNPHPLAFSAGCRHREAGLMGLTKQGAGEMHIGSGGAQHGFTEWLNERRHTWEKPETMRVIQQGALKADHNPVPSSVKEAWLHLNEPYRHKLIHSWDPKHFYPKTSEHLLLSKLQRATIATE